MSGPASEPSQAAQKLCRSLGVRSIPPPPEGFDPTRASDRELSEYGYPVRPDIKLYPELHERWNQMMSRPMTFIEPQFAVLTRRPVRQRNVVATDERRADLAVPTSPTAHWSGSVAVPEKGDAVTFVSGQWTVPAVIIPQLDGEIYASSIWVGIDGGPQGEAYNVSTDILQAGTEQNVSLFGGQTTYPWFEWWTGDQFKILNLAIRAGDIVFCSITVRSRIEFDVFMFNVTTRQVARATGTPPSGTRWTGDTVEWILETEGEEVYRQIIPSVLPQFGEVYFDSCLAATRDRKLISAGNGSFIDQLDINGQKITATFPITDVLFKVRYTAEPWA